MDFQNRIISNLMRGLKSFEFDDFREFDAWFDAPGSSETESNLRNRIKFLISLVCRNDMFYASPWGFARSRCRQTEAQIGMAASSKREDEA